MAKAKKESSKKEIDAKLEEAIKGLKDCVDREEQERGKMKDDLVFATLDQWPSEIRNEREGDQENGPRPCLTVDQINQYLVQVGNDARQGRPSIKVRPVDDAADVETAKILQGLIRNIEDQSSADIAYSGAVESAIKVGLGFFRITTEYVGEDSFDQEIRIRPIPNTFSTYLGPHIMPDGSDTEDGYIVEEMAEKDFKKQYPDKSVDKKQFDHLGSALSFWRKDDTVTVAERYYIEKTYDELLFLADGRTMDRKEYDALTDPPSIEDTRNREVRQLKWCKFTGAEIIDERDLPGKYIPIVEVIGREAHVNGERKLWGLVRPAKDSLRMYNYWVSTITEKIALAPKTPYIGAKGQFKGVEGRWRQANKKNFPYLEYEPIDVNGNAIPAPRREPSPPIETAMIQQLALIREDVKASLGMYKAALGQSESQQSGRAILALQKESDTATYHFGANQGISIRHAGRIIVDMIPHYYDTKRVIRILGEEGDMQTAHIDPEQQEPMRELKLNDGSLRRIYNPSVGTYDVSISIGPSYNTKRMEASATLLEVVKSQPEMMPMVGDLLFRSMDMPYSEQIAERLRKMLPPQLQDQNEKVPPAAMAKMQQMGQAMQAMQVKGQELEQENVQLKAKQAEGMAKIELQTQEAQAELALQKQKQDGELQLAREKAEAEIAIKQAVAQAEHGIAKQKQEFEHQCRAADEQAKLQERLKGEEAPLLENAMPRFVESFGQITQMFAQSVAQMQESNQQGMALLAQAITAPRTVTLGNIKRDGDRLASASATSATVQ